MVKRIFVEKKKGYNAGAHKVAGNIKSILNIKVGDLREFIRYDVEGLDDDADFAKAKVTVFSEPPVDVLFEENLPNLDGYMTLVIEFLPGQYDQRADSAAQCVQLLTMKKRPTIKCARVIAIKGVSEEQFEKITKLLINPVEARKGSDVKPNTLESEKIVADEVATVYGFISFNNEDIKKYHADMSFAMSVEDLKFVQEYFRAEGREPRITELKVIDTYWSDHCRHTTFATVLQDIKIESENKSVQEALDEYYDTFEKMYVGRSDKDKCMMDIATIAVKKLKKEGKLDNLDESDEINACSVVVKVDNNGVDEDWLIMFKNETHNHPTEIEPYGGAATCLGGAIRDPLSGRTYVYQAMRVTGCADPREDIANTLKGKLPQRVITTTAAAGFSSYGNQIGLATGTVAEMYHPNYKAKRLETGYVIAGAPKSNVVRQKPQNEDIVILLGGETGRDGCGGATGSSKAHTTDSVETCGAEVQKGNPLTERKIQRLFRNAEVARMIIKCNDFGAGGVSVAIGELSESLDIYLDRVPKKYDGLDGTELAISESQERMAVVIKSENLQRFIELAKEENLIATYVAKITDSGSMRMILNDKVIVDLKRSFLDTNGVKQYAKAVVKDSKADYIASVNKNADASLDKKDYIKTFKRELSRLNVCSTKGLGEIFDSTIGANTVLMPFGGKYQLTPSIVMASKPPVSSGVTDTATISSFACYPYLNEQSPFTGAIYAIVSSVSKLIASGVDYSTIRLTLQEFFKKLGQDAERWGEPVGALLGAFYAQTKLGLGAIGGKDSMSGSFEDIDVPPTLISFAMGIAKASKLISNTFASTGAVYHISIPRDENYVPKFDKLIDMYAKITDLIKKGAIVSANVSEEGGVGVAVIKSCMGNGFGFEWKKECKQLFAPYFGDFIVLAGENFDEKIFENITYLGNVIEGGEVKIAGKSVDIKDLISDFEKTLDGVFPTTASAGGEAKNVDCEVKYEKSSNVKVALPKVFIPVFPGTNCEYDTARAFEKFGAKAEIFVIKNQTSQEIEQSVDKMVSIIDNSQIIAFPGGFSGGDEPDGSGKFIATTFQNPKMAEAVMNLLYKRDGLGLGICNGFQALIKLGLVPYGKVTPQSEGAPTLTFNNIARHVSTIARIRIASTNSPWLTRCKVGEVYNVAVSHGEGRFVAKDKEMTQLIANGQIATQYVDLGGNATMVSPFNPNGSMNAIEGILSPDGKVFGKMGHTERWGENLYKNIEGNFDMQIFKSGVDFFK